MDMKHLRERTKVLSFFINIPILERDSGMKSYSKFITEKKGGTAVASPAPSGGDPLDPNNRRRIDKKFSDPSNPPKVENPEASKSNAVKQSEVSKQASKYRRAERVKGATGGKTTGSLSKGTLSFPGDRSGVTARVKSDLEARKGLKAAGASGDVSSSAPKEVRDKVNKARQTRATAAGTPDPFDPKTPKASSRPFKSLTKSKTTGSTSIPDPFKSATSNPKKVSSKPKAPSGPGPATSQAIKDIQKGMSRRGIKTTEADVAQRYMRGMQDTGRRIDPDLVGAQGVKSSGAKPEMVGSRAPAGAGDKFRAKANAVRDISKAKNADLDKALKNLTTTGNVKGKSAGVTGGLSAPKGGVKTSPGVGSKSYSKSEKTLQNMQRQMAQTGVDSSGKKLSTAERKRAFNVSKNPRAVERAVDNPPSKTFASGKTSVGPKLSKGGQLALPGQKGLPPTKIKLPKVKPELASKVKDALPGFKEVRKGAQTLKPASGASKILRGAGRVAGPALAVVGAGLDYADDRAKGYNRTSSALRTGAKHLGGAAGATLGSALGPVGTAVGYAAGHWLTSKVLDKFHKPSKPKKLKEPTAKKKVTTAVADTLNAPVRAIAGAPPKKPPAPKKVETNPRDLLKVNR